MVLGLALASATSHHWRLRLPLSILGLVARIDGVVLSLKAAPIILGFGWLRWPSTIGFCIRSSHNKLSGPNERREIFKRARAFDVKVFGLDQR